ncbi:MAG: hypothetical protein Q9170_000805 [Blastenia crenularia]
MLWSGIVAALGFGFLGASQSTPSLSVVTNDASRVIPGSIYLAPNKVPGAGPYVFNLTGEILLNGAGKIPPGSAYNFQPCVYKEGMHFCLWDGTVTNGYGNGTALVLNQYFLADVALAGVDYHAFDIRQSLDTTTGQVSDTALLTVYTPVRRDLSAYGIPNQDNQGWVIDCRLRAVDLASGKVVFDWSSLDHVPLSESQVLPTGAINGMTQQFAWDYFHLNSIARLGSGDYIVSSRHTSTIYRVSGKDGSIMWRLGGKASDFKLQGFTFSSQHDVRVIHDNGASLTLSLFDNAYNTFTPPQGDPSGKIIQVNSTSKKARLLNQYNAPQSGFQCGDGGSVLLLPKGNVFIGWGSCPYVTEHTPDGQLIYSAHFGTLGSSASSYRAFKAPFIPLHP